jgi:hypothetical protein
MIDMRITRGCGHEQDVRLDETGPYYERKLENMKRTRCQDCVKALEAKQKQDAKNRKEQRRLDELTAHWLSVEHRRIEASAVKRTTPSTDGVVQFHISVHIDAAQLGTWKPERIAQLFAGVAQMIRAKGGVDA